MTKKERDCCPSKRFDEGHAEEIAELEGALRQCQRVLAVLINPESKGGGISNSTAWASCVAAEAKARSVLGDKT
ncbi:hypothetical protein FBQ96_12285 [Nitrospirales bacterium NOB]|nr:hypothetical protein [Nitrospirales bacterium NOB]